MINLVVGADIGSALWFRELVDEPADARAAAAVPREMLLLRWAPSTLFLHSLCALGDFLDRAMLRKCPRSNHPRRPGAPQ